FLRLHVGLVFAAFGLVLAFCLSASAQKAPTYQYIFPKVANTRDSRLIIGNLSPRSATAEVDFMDSPTTPARKVFVDMSAGAQERVSVPFEGTAMITSSVPLSAVATFVAGAESLDTIAPASGGSYLIIPFGTGTSGDVEVSVFNPSSGTVSFVVAAISPNGETLGQTRPILKPLETYRQNVSDFLSAPPPGATRD